MNEKQIKNLTSEKGGTNRFYFQKIESGRLHLIVIISLFFISIRFDLVDPVIS